MANNFQQMFSVPPPQISDNSNYPGYSNQYSGRNDDQSGGRQGNNYGSNNFGRDNKGFKGSNDRDVVVQEDTIFVSGMSPETSEYEIANHFGAIGIIKKDKRTMKPKIWVYKNKETGLSKGECTITYDDTNAAQSAISWFDGKDFNGCVIKVSLAERKQNNWQNKGAGRGGFNKGGGGGSFRGGNDRGSGNQDFEKQDYRDNRGPRNSNSNPRGGGGGGNSKGGNDREGDWNCSECNNKNFKWRNACNRCQAPKEGGQSGGSYGGSKRDFGGNGNGGNKRDNFGGGGGGAMRGNDWNSRDNRQRPY